MKKKNVNLQKFVFTRINYGIKRKGDFSVFNFQLRILINVES